MNQFKKDEHVINSDQAKNAPKKEQKVDDVKLGGNVPSLVKKVENSQNNEPVSNPAKSEQK